MTNDEKRAIIDAAMQDDNFAALMKRVDRPGALNIKDLDILVSLAALGVTRETLEKENIELRQRLEEMKELLKDLQWDADAYCPICGKGTFAQPEKEHYPGCKLAALLREEQPCD